MKPNLTLQGRRERNTKSERHGSRGFTAVELLVVIGVIALLAALLLPALAKAGGHQRQ